MAYVSGRWGRGCSSVVRSCSSSSCGRARRSCEVLRCAVLRCEVVRSSGVVLRSCSVVLCEVVRGRAVLCGAVLVVVVVLVVRCSALLRCEVVRSCGRLRCSSCCGAVLCAAVL